MADLKINGFIVVDTGVGCRIYGEPGMEQPMISVRLSDMTILSAQYVNKNILWHMMEAASTRKEQTDHWKYGNKS